MKNLFYAFAFLLAIPMLTGCSKDDDGDIGIDETKIRNFAIPFYAHGAPRETIHEHYGTDYFIEIDGPRRYKTYRIEENGIQNIKIRLNSDDSMNLIIVTFYPGQENFDFLINFLQINFGDPISPIFDYNRNFLDGEGVLYQLQFDEAYENLELVYGVLL